MPRARNMIGHRSYLHPPSLALASLLTAMVLALWASPGHAQQCSPYNVGLGQISYWDSQAGKFICINCSAYAGTVADHSVNKCVPCPVGTVPDSSYEKCVACPPNTINIKGVCAPCPQGTGANPAHTACIACPAGTRHNEFTGLCDQCPPGSYGWSKKGEDNACIGCPAGEIAPVYGAIVCVRCRGNTYANDNNTACLKCPLGTKANALHSACVPLLKTRPQNAEPLAPGLLESFPGFTPPKPAPIGRPSGGGGRSGTGAR
jgi:hypothetical protein